MNRKREKFNFRKVETQSAKINSSPCVSVCLQFYCKLFELVILPVKTDIPMKLQNRYFLPRICHQAIVYIQD